MGDQAMYKIPHYCMPDTTVLKMSQCHNPGRQISLTTHTWNKNIMIHGTNLIPLLSSFWDATIWQEHSNPNVKWISKILQTILEQFIRQLLKNRYTQIQTNHDISWQMSTQILPQTLQCKGWKNEIKAAPTPICFSGIYIRIPSSKVP